MKTARRQMLQTVLTALAAPSLGWAQARPDGTIRLALIEGLSGPLGNAGEAVYRNLLWAVERVNARGGVKLVGGDAFVDQPDPLGFCGVNAFAAVEQHPGMRLADEADEANARRAAQRKKPAAAEPTPVITDPYASDETSYILPLLFTVGAFIPLLFCLCKL